MSKIDSVTCSIKLSDFNFINPLYLLNSDSEIELSAERKENLKKLYEEVTKLFKESFNEELEANVIKNNINDLLVYNLYENKVSGICMIHSSPPYKFITSNDKNGIYIYNFCVQPSLRNKGIGTEIMDFIKENHSIIHCHVEAKNKKAIEWIEKQRFGNNGKAYGNYLEYTWPCILSPKHKAIQVTEIISNNYDPKENVIYMS